MRSGILAALLLVSGCDYVKQATDYVESFAQTEEERIAAQEERIRKLKSADDLVSVWINKVGDQTHPAGGFVRHEGLTEADPWGNFIKVVYHQEGTQEIVTVTSAGPDGIFHTSDDLSRHRSTTNFWKWPLLWVVVVWVSCSALVLFFAYLNRLSNMKQAGWKRRRKKHPLVSSLAMAVLAPFLILGYLFMFLAMIAGGLFDMDFDGGFDFLDLDIDL